MALIWYEAVVVPATIAKDPATGYTVGIITGIGLILNIMLLVDFLTAIRRPTTPA